MFHIFLRTYINFFTYDYYFSSHFLARFILHALALLYALFLDRNDESNARYINNREKIYYKTRDELKSYDRM